MRPPCQDGVIVSDGMLYWGPWMCGCNLSLYGHVALTSAGDFDFQPELDDSRLVKATGDLAGVEPLAIHANDWPTHLGDNARTAMRKASIAERVKPSWTLDGAPGLRTTAPVTGGGLAFVGDESGAVRAIDARDGSTRWKAYTGGAIYFPPALWEGRLFVGSADGRAYAFEAATGRQLWCFRAAPAERWISVYGKLSSTWPVSGGVVVEDGVLYAAAGIADFSGTYVYALDATSGQPKWCNDSSGQHSDEVDCGISLQGNLFIADGELRFQAGSKYGFARYDLKTGECLNEPDNGLTSKYRTAFAPYYPEYARYLSLAYPLPDGRELTYTASYEGSQHAWLTLFAPATAGSQPPAAQGSATPAARRGAPRRAVVWADKSEQRFSSFIASPKTLLAAGHTGVGPDEKAFLAAIDIETGADRWREPLPAAVVQGGMAIDHAGRIVASLENGQVVAFAPAN
jgi:outer membrane protein assembly factor BamB